MSAGVWPNTQSFEEGETNLNLYGQINFTSRETGADSPAVRFPVDDFNPSSLFEGLDGSGTKVCVIDTGIDPSHPALKDRIITSASRNYTNDNSSDTKDVTDGNGHGTHCAGIIAAEQREGAIMYGVAPKAELVICKGLSNNGERGVIHLVPSRLAAAVRHAVAEGCDVISMSLGLPDLIPGLTPSLFGEYTEGMADFYKAVQEALAAGVVVVAAAGNDGRNPSNTITPPAQYGGVVTVASHDDRGTRSSFSSFGGELDFMAPGEVYSCWPLGLRYRGRPGREYEELQGTSMATPLVAGLAALIKQAGSVPDSRVLSSWMRRALDYFNFRGRNNYEVREIIRLMAERPTEHRRDDGYGRLVRAYEYVYVPAP